jgi:hypothetical protein
MNIKEKLELLYRHLVFSRGVGHTYTMMNGVNGNDKARVVVPHMAVGQFLKINRNKLISLDDLDKLRGSNFPLAFDNTALIKLFGDALMEIRSLEAEIEMLKNGEKQND